MFIPTGSPCWRMGKNREVAKLMNALQELSFAPIINRRNGEAVAPCGERLAKRFFARKTERYQERTTVQASGLAAKSVLVFDQVSPKNAEPR